MHYSVTLQTNHDYQPPKHLTTLFMEPSAHHQDAINALLTTLSDTAAEVRRLEKIAHALLYENDDQQGYHDQLRHKAIALSELAEKVSLSATLPPHLNTLIQERVGSISFEADRALRLDSVFYMSVLLYPEEYQEGTPNELENFINHLRIG